MPICSTLPFWSKPPRRAEVRRAAGQCAKKGLIYLATNKKNDKKYVGLTLRPLKRCIQSHVAAALKGKGYEHTLQEAIRKFGIESITY